MTKTRTRMKTRTEHEHAILSLVYSYVHGRRCSRPRFVCCKCSLCPWENGDRQMDATGLVALFSRPDLMPCISVSFTAGTTSLVSALAPSLGSALPRPSPPSRQQRHFGYQNEFWPCVQAIVIPTCVMDRCWGPVCMPIIAIEMWRGHVFTYHGTDTSGTVTNKPMRRGSLARYYGRH